MKRKWISLAAFSFLVLSSGFILATITKSLQFESSSPAAQIYFFRRQVRDETGKLIDLNKEPSPEPDSPASQGHGRGKNSNQGHSTALSLSSQGLDGGKQMPRYIMPRIYRKIDVPPGLAAEQVKEFRSKVKNQRRREASKRAKSSTDPAVRKIVSENRERALAKQRDYDRNMRTRVKDGIGTENENRIIAKKKVLCQQYYHNVRKHKKQAERQELFKRLGKGASTSANQ